MHYNNYICIREYSQSHYRNNSLHSMSLKAAKVSTYENIHPKLADSAVTSQYYQGP
uniref:Uncharacterized protein n=1 Tax=Amphimedon queenslandica TaxID=400682 RepID=A0A1X7UBC2_AMPQE